MATTVTSLQTLASRLPSDQIRDLVVPAHTINKGCLGAVLHSKPPWLYDLETGDKLDTPFTVTAVGMAFRPFAKTEASPARNQEVAIIHGDNSPRVLFYDITLGELLEPMAFPRASAVAYSKVGDKLALGNSSGRVCVYDLKDGHQRKELVSVLVSKSAIVRLEFSPQGESVYALTAGGAVFSVELSTGTVAQHDLSGGDEDADFECWAHALHEGARIAVLAGSVNRVSGHCNVWILDIDKGRRRVIRTGHTRYVRRLHFVGMQQLIVLGDAGAEIYDLSTRAKTSVKRAGVPLKVAYSAFQAGPYGFVMGSAKPSKG